MSDSICLCQTEFCYLRRRLLMLTRFYVVLALIAHPVFAAFAQASQAAPTNFSQAVDQITARPEFRHALFGIEIYSLDSKKVLYAKDEELMFTPASTTKLL